jgi:hypothetical protein
MLSDLLPHLKEWASMFRSLFPVCRQSGVSWKLARLHLHFALKALRCTDQHLSGLSPSSRGRRFRARSLNGWSTQSNPYPSDKPTSSFGSQSLNRNIAKTFKKVSQFIPNLKDGVFLRGIDKMNVS